MSELQEKIEKILAIREKMSSEILSQFANINTLKDNVESIKQQIVKGQIKGCERFVADLEQAEAILESASDNFNFLKQRIKRTDAIYIGLAGESRAGKSTFIQALTGLPNDLIPSAGSDNNKPTTAVHSEIHNSPQKEARIYFLSKFEFEQKIKEMLTPFGLEDNCELEKFEQLDLTTISNKNQAWEKLQYIQEAIPAFKDFLLNNSEPVILTEDKFSEGKYYFTYMYNDATHRFYPAVKETKIYAPFSGVADDVQVVLWDLPGFSESSKVTATTIDKLKTVDFALYIENTSSAFSHLQEAFSDCHKKLQDNIMLKDTFKYYMTFLLNRYEKEGDDISVVDNKCAQMKADLNKKTPHEVFACPLIDKEKNLNKDAVKNIFGSVADTLGDTLSKMDGELYGLFKKTISSGELNETLEKIKNTIAQQSPDRRKSSKDSSRAEDMQEILSNKYNEMMCDIYAKISVNQAEFKAIVKEKKKYIKECIENNLFTESMDVWQKKASDVHGAGKRDLKRDECNRLWVEIVTHYEGLNSYFETKLKEFKAKVVDIFKQQTNNFISQDIVPDTIQDTIDTLLRKLDDAGLMNECGNETDIYKSFAFLKDLRQDFRQSIYPHIFENEVDEYLNIKKSGTPGNLRKKDGLADFKGDDSIETIKTQLINFAINANAKFCDTITENDRYFFYYLLSSLKTFEEWLIHSKKGSTDFTNFVETFNYELFPEEYGEGSNRQKLASLSTSVEKAINIVKQFN